MDEHVKSLLSAYLDQEVSDEEAERIAAHLESCKECREAFDELKAVKNGLFSLYNAFDLPSGFPASVMSRINEADIPPFINRRFAVMAGFLTLVMLSVFVAGTYPVLYTVMKLASLFVMIGMTLLRAAAVVAGALPYLPIIFYAGAVCFIIVALWLLWRLLTATGVKKGELS
jgi:anti-sigma factor RsiW